MWSQPGSLTALAASARSGQSASSTSESLIPWASSHVMPFSRAASSAFFTVCFDMPLVRQISLAETPSAASSNMSFALALFAISFSFRRWMAFRQAYAGGAGCDIYYRREAVHIMRMGGAPNATDGADWRE